MMQNFQWVYSNEISAKGTALPVWLCLCPADLTKAGEALVAASVSICAHVQSILPSSTDKWQQRSGVESSCTKETVNLTGNKG